MTTVLNCKLSDGSPATISLTDWGTATGDGKHYVSEIECLETKVRFQSAFPVADFKTDDDRADFDIETMVSHGIDRQSILSALGIGNAPTAKEITVDLLEEADDRPELLVELIPWLQSILDRVPDQHKAQVVVNIETESGWNEYECSVNFSIFYTRTETQQECDARLQKENMDRAAQRIRQEAAERATYERLKAKFWETR